MIGRTSKVNYNSGEEFKMSTDAISTTIDTTSELYQFHQFLGRKLASGEQLTPEDVVDLWREEHPTPEELEATVAAVLKAQDAMNAGESGVPAREFLARFRAEHGIP